MLVSLVLIVLRRFVDVVVLLLLIRLLFVDVNEKYHRQQG